MTHNSALRVHIGALGINSNQKQPSNWKEQRLIQYFFSTDDSLRRWLLFESVSYFPSYMLRIVSLHLLPLASLAVTYLSVRINFLLWYSSFLWIVQLTRSLQSTLKAIAVYLHAYFIAVAHKNDIFLCWEKGKKRGQASPVHSHFFHFWERP